MYRMIDSKSLKIKDSYFNTGKWVETFLDKSKKFVMYNHTTSELYDPLIKSGFKVERIIEPDSRKRYSYDPWYGLWDYTPKLLRMAPPTIIFKSIKLK